MSLRTFGTSACRPAPPSFLACGHYFKPMAGHHWLLQRCGPCTSGVTPFLMNWLRSVLLALHEVTGADALNSLSQGLADADWMDEESRLIWQFVRFASDSTDEGPPFPIWRVESNIGELLGDEFGPGLAKIVRSDRPKRNAELAKVAVRWLGTRSTPKDGDFFGDGVSQERRWGRACVGYIRSLGANPTVEANRVLNTLIGDAALSPWLPDLTHARAQQARLRRDVEFKHPELAGVLAALEGGHH